MHSGPACLTCQRACAPRVCLHAKVRLLPRTSRRLRLLCHARPTGGRCSQQLRSRNTRIQVLREHSRVLSDPLHTARCRHPAADGGGGWLGWMDGGMDDRRLSCLRHGVLQDSRRAGVNHKPRRGRQPAPAVRSEGCFPFFFFSSWPFPLCWQLICPDRVGVELHQPRSQ